MIEEIIALPDPVRDQEKFRKVRHPYFNASATACLFGEHPFLSAADYWLQKMTGDTTEVTDAMMRGHHLEAALADWFGKEEGFTVNKENDLYVAGHLAATPDYWAGKTLIEIKSTAERDLEEPLKYWRWQVQTQMYCTKAQDAWIVWLDGRLQLHKEHVLRDPVAIELIVDRSGAFMDSIAQEVMPDWVEREARHIIAQFPDPHDAIEVGEKGWDVVEEYWRHKGAEKYHKDQANAARDVLFNAAENHDELTYDGKTIATLRPRKVAAAFDKKQFAQDHPDMYDEYMAEPTSTRVLNIPKKIKAAIEGSTP